MNLKQFAFLLLSAGLVSLHASAQPNKAINEKLSMITSLVVNDNSIELPEDSILRKYLKIEVIAKEYFRAKQKTRVNWLVSDTTKIRKKNGVLRLPTTTGSKTFTDKLVENDGREEYEYIGQIAVLNAYLVFCMFWEEMEYTLISKKNGTEISSFSERPYISPDKKKIISIYEDPEENDSEIGLYAIINNSIKSTVQVRFKNWTLAPYGEMFWAADGKFYLAVQYSDKFWNENGNYNTDELYIRISLL